jgi:hypothetical protein
MATCTGCGVNVGCGCQLTNGLCPTCVNKKQQQPPKDVNSKDNKV